jgi:3-methyladenine DNA glycosylase AlkD
MNNLFDLKKDLQKLKDPKKAVFLQRFFKTGKGEYGEHDVFIGITVPDSRQLALKYKDLTLSEISELLKSKIHEERLIALFILILQFNKSSLRGLKGRSNLLNEQKKIYEFYIDNTKYINNWDLVDSSAHKIVGEYLLERDRGVLYKLAKSNSLWERRISIIATFAFIRKKEYEDSLKITEILIEDKHDLIQKAVGWVLREIGKTVSEEIEEEFLKKHYKNMGRIALRYAIERFPEEKRQKYLKGVQ